MLRMVQNCIMVEIPEKKEKTDGGIYLAPNKEKLSEGTVVAVGPGKRNKRGEVVPVSLKAGDTILFEPGRGVEVEASGKKCLIMREVDVAAITDKIHGNLFDSDPYYSQPAVRV